MNARQFLTKLSVITLFAIGLVLLLNLHPSIKSAQLLSWGTILCFVLLCVAIYIISSTVAKQKNKNNFTSVILLVMITKMFLCILLVAIYSKLYNPKSNFFLIPFFSIYLIYLIFEVHLMTRIGKDG